MSAAVPFNPIRFADTIVPDSELHLVPALLDFLNPDNELLPDPLSVTLGGLGPRRSSSGYFSPSIHPTWPLEDLVKYAKDPAYVKPEDPFPRETKISMLMGSFFHDVFNQVFRSMGILVDPEGRNCPLCRRPRSYKPGVEACNEHAVFDEVLRRRGHVDDVLRLPTLPGLTGIDVKTCAHHAIKSINNHDPQPYIDGSTKLRAKYYGQVQDYMDMTGWEQMILLFVGLGFPWEFKEVVILRDQPYIDRLREKYATARAMALAA